jgi:hypothetical protein
VAPLVQVLEPVGQKHSVGLQPNLVLFLFARDGLTHDQPWRTVERCQDAEAQLREPWLVCQRRECTMPSRPANVPYVPDKIIGLRSAGRGQQPQITIAPTAPRTCLAPMHL